MKRQITVPFSAERFLSLLSFLLCSEFLLEYFFFFPKSNVCVCMPQNNFLRSDVKANFIVNH